MTPGRVVGVLAAVAMVVLGFLWAAQGLGYLETESTTDSTTGGVLGPIVAGLGVALAIVVLQRRDR